MDKSGEWRLSPAYDVTYSYNPAGDFTSRQQMTVNRKRDDITDKDFLEVAKRQGLKLTSAKRMIKDVRAVLSSWSQYADSATVSGQKEESIGRLIVPS
jgi:serine/threonine-protein kinase HipA